MPGLWEDCLALLIVIILIYIYKSEVWLCLLSENAHCDPGFFYCGEKYMQEHPCMKMKMVCDNFVECLSYNADESVCGECPDNYCQNDGKCTTEGNEDPPACK